MKKLYWGLEILKKSNFDLKKLRKFGFRACGYGSGGTAWLHPKRKVVIKQSYIEAVRNPRKQHIPPTLFVKSNKYYNKFIIQAYCKRKRLLRAFDILSEIYSPIKYDIAPKNVGWYRNRPVMIDW